MAMSLREVLRTRVRNRHRERFWTDRDREEHTCDGCGCTYAEAGFRWEVHHRDGDWLNGHPMNHVGICHRCHTTIHRTQRVAADVGAWRERFDDLGEGLSESVWRGMTAVRKAAHDPDCAFKSCDRAADTTVEHHRFGERYVCRIHIVAAASGVESVASADTEVGA